MADTDNTTAPTTGPTRSLYLGGLSPNVTYYDICKTANQYGGLELVRLVPQKKCAFVNFINEDDAARLFNDAQGGIELCGQKSYVGWAKSSEMKPEIRAAVEEGATRNLFVAGIGSTPEHVLSSIFLRFGDIENIVCMAKKGFGFVNMTSIKAALEAKTVSETSGIDMAGRRLTVKFAKEGTHARDPRSVTQRQAPVYQGMNPAFQQQQQRSMQMGQQFQQRMGPGGAGGHGQFGGGAMVHQQMGLGGGSRAIYLGNLPQEVQNNDLCKLGNRFGVLELVRINREKKNGFINFMDPSAAEACFMAAQQRPVVLHNVQVRVGWAKSSPLRPELTEAAYHGATRNLYIGGISENTTEEELKELFSSYCGGEFDGIHILRQKKIAFVNLTSIKAAIQAKEGIQAADPPIVIDGVPIKVNFAKETIGGRPMGGGGGVQGSRNYADTRNVQKEQGYQQQQHFDSSHAQQGHGNQYEQQQHFDGHHNGYDATQHQHQHQHQHMEMDSSANGHNWQNGY